MGEIKASIEQLKTFKDNGVWREIHEGFKTRLDLVKNKIVSERQIDKIRLLQGKAEELIYNIGLVDLMIEDKQEGEEDGK